MNSKCKFYVDMTAMNNEVTGSCTLVTVNLPNKEIIRFFTDCGLFQEAKYDNKLNKELLFNPQDIDFCLITHNHVDHVGKLPYIVKKGYSRSIYLTKVSSVLLPLALDDSCKVLKSVAKKNNTKALYNERDVENTISLLKPCEFNETIVINDNVRVMFFKNGHLLGAALILVQISYPEYEDINLLFTGDYNNKNIFFNVEPLPDWVLKLKLTVIQESTYGKMTTKDIQSCFANNIQKCIANQGEVVSLVFSLGRAQEILYELKTMQEKEQLDVNVPIYFDGKLARRYTDLYLKKDLGIKSEMKDFLPKNLVFVDEQIRYDLLKDTSCKIIITTSGMGTYGVAPIYLREFIKRENCLIQYTGYTAEGTLAYCIKKANEGDKVQIRGTYCIKRANVQSTTEFSAHAKSDEMIKFLSNFENLNLILVNHGEEGTKEYFAERILDEIKAKDVCILSRKYIFRISAYGLEKTISKQMIL